MWSCTRPRQPSLFEWSRASSEVANPAFDEITGQFCCRRVTSQLVFCVNPSFLAATSQVRPPSWPYFRLTIERPAGIVPVALGS